MKSLMIIKSGLVATVAVLLITAGMSAPFVKTEKSDANNMILRKPDNVNVDSILASVNGEPISLGDVLEESRHEEARVYLAFTGGEVYNRIKQIRRKVVDEIINRKLILADFHEKTPFTIPRQYVESMLDSLAEHYGCAGRKELASKARKSGTTLEQLQQRAEERVAVQGMINNYYFTHVNPTPREIYEYFEQHRDELSEPAKIRLRLLMLKKEREDFDACRATLEKTLSESSQQQVFVAMVKLYSDGPAAASGGNLGWIECVNLRPEFAQAASNAKPGIVVGPIDTPEGIYYLRVEDFQKPRTAEYKDVGGRLKNEIENRLKKTAYKRYVASLRKSAIIRYYF